MVYPSGNNTTCTGISYINKMSRPTSLTVVSQRSTTVEAHHLRGHLNIVADFESRISGPSRHQRLATGSIDFSGCQQQMGPLLRRSFCKQTDSALSKIRELETRSRSGGSRCLYAGLEPTRLICFHSIRPDRVVSKASSATVSLPIDNNDSNPGTLNPGTLCC